LMGSVLPYIAYMDPSWDMKHTPNGPYVEIPY
jgi:hypothetical protein